MAIVLDGTTGTAAGLTAGGNALLAGSATQAFSASTFNASGLITAQAGVAITGANALRGSYGGGGVTSNFASGDGALLNNTTGSNNTANGVNALLNNTTGSGNTAFNPINSAGAYAPVFSPIAENNRLCMGSTGVTNAYVQVAWTVVSDARDKTDFAPVPHGLDFVSKLQTTAYRYKMNRTDVEGHGPVRYGFKAQEVMALEGATPVIVDAEDLDKLRFNDQAMIAVLVNALQELNAKFDAYVSTHP